MTEKERWIGEGFIDSLPDMLLIFCIGCAGLSIAAGLFYLAKFMAKAVF